MSPRQLYGDTNDQNDHYGRKIIFCAMGASGEISGRHLNILILYILRLKL